MSSESPSPPPASAGEPGRSGILSRVTDAIDVTLRKFFFRMGYFIARRPWTVIGVMLLVALLGSVGVLRLTSESRGDRLWVPQGSRAKREKENVVDDNFGSFTRFSNVLFTGKTIGDDIGTKSALLNVIKVMRFGDTIEGEPVEKPDGDGTPTTFEERCQKRPDANGNLYCLRTSALDLFYDPDNVVNVEGGPNFLSTVEEKVNGMTDAEVKATLLSDESAETFFGSPLIRDSFISKTGNKVTGLLVQQRGENNLVTVDGEEHDYESESWELAYSEELSASPPKVDTSDISWTVDTVKGGSEALESALTGDLSKFAIGIVLLVLYVIFYLGEFHAVQSRMLLGLIAIMTAGLSLGVTYGISSLVGWFYGPVHSILPLLIIGIGVDDIFVVTKSLNDINFNNSRFKNKDIPTRIGLALSRSGTAVTVTSVTNFIVFLASAVSQLPALRFFSLWACVGVLADYLFSTTFFVAALTLDQRRIDANRRDVVPCVRVAEPKTKNWCGLEFGVFSRFFTKFGTFITGSVSRIVFLVLFAGILAAGSVGAARLYLKFEFSFFYPEGTAQKDYQNALDSQFEPAQSSFVYVKGIDLTKAENQRKLIDLCKVDTGIVAQSDWVVPSSVDCWYEAMRVDAELTGDEVFAEGTFSSAVQTFLGGPGARYARNVVLDKGVVKYSRFGFIYRYADSNDEEIERLEKLREDVDGAGFGSSGSPEIANAFPYDFGNIFVEQYIALPGEVGLSLALSISAVGVVTFLLIGNPLVGLLSMLTVGLVLIGVVGSMHYTGFNLNSVSVISLSVSVGLSCDQIVHIARSFLEQVGTRRERSIKALEELGPPVFQAAFSTFLAILTLSLASSYIFKSLFWGFLWLLVLAAVHGLIFMPIILSFIGPRGFYETEEEKDMAELRLEEACIRSEGKAAAAVDSGDANVVVE